MPHLLWIRTARPVINAENVLPGFTQCLQLPLEDLSLTKAVSSPVLPLSTEWAHPADRDSLHLLIATETLGWLRVRLDLMPGSSPHRKMDIKWTILPSDIVQILEVCQSGRTANVSIRVSELALSHWCSAFGNRIQDAMLPFLCLSSFSAHSFSVLIFFFPFW